MYHRLAKEWKKIVNLRGSGLEKTAREPLYPSIPIQLTKP